jgi:hypothetical protein
MVSSSTNTSKGSEESEKEYQRRVIMAFGEVFFKVFVPFMRRALVEGVYGTKLDASFQGGELLPGVVMDWEDFSLENGEVEKVKKTVKMRLSDSQSTQPLMFLRSLVSCSYFP